MAEPSSSTDVTVIPARVIFAVNKVDVRPVKVVGDDDRYDVRRAINRVLKQHHVEQAKNRSSTAPRASKSIDCILATSVPPSILDTASGRISTPTSVFTATSLHGLVGSVLQAHADHNRLVITPDNIWTAILTQLSFWVNRHAEALRHVWVPMTAPGEQRKVHVHVGMSTRNFCSDHIMKYVEGMQVDAAPETIDLIQWALPTFSTTTPTQRAVFGAILMSALKAYYSFEMSIGCGIPEIELCGTVADYQLLRKRIDRLLAFEIIETKKKPGRGDDNVGASNPIRRWYAMLSVVLDQMIEAARGKPHRPFWEQIVHMFGSGYTDDPTEASGWILAFCPFNMHGHWCLRSGAPQYDTPEYKRAAKWIYNADAICGEAMNMGWMSLDSISACLALVPIELVDTCPVYEPKTQKLSNNSTVTSSKKTTAPDDSSDHDDRGSTSGDESSDAIDSDDVREFVSSSFDDDDNNLEGDSAEDSDSASDNDTTGFSQNGNTTETDTRRREGDEDEPLLYLAAGSILSTNVHADGQTLAIRDDWFLTSTK